jgi:hypothetical protein
MGLKSLRLSSLILVLAIVLIRFFSAALWPSDLAVHTEDKIYLLQAGEDWVIYFKHAESRHPFFDADNIKGIQLESETMTMELSLGHLASETLIDQTQMTIMTLVHPFKSTHVPLTFEEPELSIYMVDGSRLSFRFKWVGIFPEKENFHALPFSELYGLYAEDTLGLQGVYLTLENPTSFERCITYVDLGFGALKPSDIDQTSVSFTPHQRLDDYEKVPFTGCIKAYETAHLLIELKVPTVCESVPITLQFNDGLTAYLEPVRLVRNVPFHHDMPLIEGQFHD